MTQFRLWLLLCCIGIVMDSFTKNHVYIQFIRVLQQIAIGYLIAFLFLHLGPIGQAAGVVALLGGHTLAFWWDGGDQAFDSTVLLDHFQWITSGPVSVSTVPAP